MSALASDIALDNPADNLKGPLWLSVLMHAALAGFLIYSGIHSHTGDLWGGAGGAITVGLVGNVPGIPMPRPEMETPNRVVDESKGLYKAEPPPEVKEPPPPDTIALPKFKLEKPPAKIQFAQIEGARESHAASRECSSLRRWRHANSSLHIVRHGRWHIHPGRHGGRRCGWRKFRESLLLVRGSSAAAHQRQLAAVHNRSENRISAAGDRHVRYFARRHDHEYSDHEIERQSFGGYVRSARHT